MLTRVRSVSIPLLAAATLAGCDTAPTDVAATATLSPSYALGPPEESGNENGALVLRADRVEFLLVFDAERELLAAHMPSTLCQGGSLNAVELLRVDKPSQVGPLFAKVTSDEATVAIYRTTSPADAGLDAPIDSYGFVNVADFGALCAFLSGPDLLAEGTVRRFTTFSAASFHGNWTGTVQGVDGQDYHLTEVYQLNADAHDPFNPDTFFEPVVEIRLRPVP